MAMNGKTGTLFAIGLVVGVAAGVAGVLSLNDRDETPASASAPSAMGGPAAAPATVAPVVVGGAGPRCAELAPLLAKAPDGDGKESLRTAAGTSSASDIAAILLKGKEAAAGERQRDAEILFLNACREAQALKGSDVPAADAQYQLARHYTNAAAFGAARSEDLYERANRLYSASLQIYQVRHGATHEKTRFAREGLSTVQQVTGVLPPLPGPVVAEAKPAAPAPAPVAPAQGSAEVQAAREQAAREQVAKEQAAREQAAREQVAKEQAAREQVAREQAAKDQVARELAARDKAARELAAREKAASELAAKSAQEQAAREQAARQQAAREQVAREQAAREQAAREVAAREKAAREVAAKAAKEQAARELAAREQAARALAARQAAVREAAAKAAKEQAALQKATRDAAAKAAKDQAARQQAAAREQAARERVASAAVRPVPPPPAPDRRTTSPSFNCAQARSTTERLICGDEELARMDRDLGRLHQRAKEAAPDRRAFQRGSDAEWKRREETCRDRDCLRAWYAQRRQELSAAADAPRAAAPPERAPARPVLRAARQQAPVVTAPPGTASGSATAGMGSN